MEPDTYRGWTECTRAAHHERLTCTAHSLSSSRTASSARLHTIWAVCASTLRGFVSYTHLQLGAADHYQADYCILLRVQGLMRGLETWWVRGSCDCDVVDTFNVATFCCSGVALSWTKLQDLATSPKGTEQQEGEANYIMPRRCPLLATNGAPM